MSNHERPEKLRATAFDGLAAALSPALIIGMIGSLVFFLVIAFYRGQYDARLMYILALYTAATVLVARIAIESDRARAAAFAVPLAIAAMLGMMRFVTINGDWAALSWIVNIGLLGLTYYLADRITFDCTLLEEDRESLQGGLLQTIGSSMAVSTVEQHRAALFNPPAQPKQSSEDAANRLAKASKQPIGAAPLKKAKHNPGVWVLYFALIAFPLFGVGQLVIPDERQRAIAFWCLVAYLGCALALLMTTSLLGMRRYLRQRGAMMPPDITAKWLVGGGLITCAILVACMLMPLPGKQLSVAGLKIELTSPDNLTTSKFGWGNDGKNDGQAGQANEQSQGEGEADKQGQESKQGQENKQGQGNKQGEAPQGDRGQPSENGQGQSENSDSAQSQSGQSNEQNKNSSQPSEKGQQASQASGKGDQGQPGGQQGQANDPGKTQPGAQDRSSTNQNKSENKDQSDQQSATKPNDQGNEPRGNEPQGNDPKSNRENNRPNDQPNKQPNNQPQAQPQPEQAGKPSPDEPNADNNQPQPDQAAPESEPLRAGNSLSQTSRSLASSLLDTLKTLGSLFKWLLIAVLAGIVIFFVVTHIEEVKRLITDLMNFINALLGRRSNSAPATQPEDEPAVSGPTRRPFSAFPNPFSRSLQGWQGPQVVQHTFAALEAWAAQRGRVRAVDQTAEEFARKLIAQEPELERLPLQAASMLDRVMFAGWQPSRQEVAALEQLWDRMSART